MRRVGIIHALGTIGSKVDAMPPDFIQAVFHVLLQLKARVVAANGNGLFHEANIPALSSSCDFSTPSLFTSLALCSYLLLTNLYQHVPRERCCDLALHVQNAMLHQPLMNMDPVRSSPLVIHIDTDPQKTRIVHCMVPSPMVHARLPFPDQRAFLIIGGLLLITRKRQLLET